MFVQVPECFLDNPNILKLPALTLLHYFNRDVSNKITVQINQHMLLHIFNGSKTITHEGIEHTVLAKQTVFIAKGQYVMSEILSFENSCFDGIMVFFEDEFLFSLFHKYALSINKTLNHEFINYRLLHVKDSISLHETMLSTKSYLQRGSDHAVLIQLKFEEIFLQLLQSDSSDEIHTYFQSLYSGGLYRLKNLLETVEFDSVESMIQKSKLSEPQFRKTFYQLYAQTPKEWLLQRALRKSQKLLQNKQLNVTEVSLECGFQSLSWFIKSFKKEFGITPKQYQQNC